MPPTKPLPEPGWNGIAFVLAVNSAIFLVSLTLFALLRRRRSCPERHPLLASSTSSTASPATRRLRTFFFATWDELEAVVGPQGATYLRFESLCLMLLAAMTVFSLPVILPVNALSDSMLGVEGAFTETTVKNVRPGSPALWTHVVYAYLFTAAFVFVFIRTAERLGRTAADKQWSVERSCTVHVIRGMPPSLRSDASLFRFLEIALPNRVASVAVVRRAGPLLRARRRRIVLEEQCERFSILQQSQSSAADHEVEAQPWSPGLPHNGVGVGAGGGTRLNGCCCRYDPTGGKCCPSWRCLGFGFCCRVASDHDRSLLRQYDAAVESEIDACAAFNDARASDAAFIRFKLASDARDFLDPNSTRFYRTIMQDHAQHAGIPGGPGSTGLLWHADPAPEPSDIDWRRVSTLSGTRWLVYAVVNLFVAILMVFLTTPTAVLSTLRSLSLYNTTALGNTFDDVLGEVEDFSPFVRIQVPHPPHTTPAPCVPLPYILLSSLGTVMCPLNLFIARCRVATTHHPGSAWPLTRLPRIPLAHRTTDCKVFLRLPAHAHTRRREQPFAHAPVLHRTLL